jgi:hypothetical protein
MRARFEVCTVVTAEITVLWSVMPCGLVEVYRHFRYNYCLHHTGRY